MKSKIKVKGINHLDELKIDKFKLKESIKNKLKNTDVKK